MGIKVYKGEDLIAAYDTKYGNGTPVMEVTQCGALVIWDEPRATRIDGRLDPEHVFAAGTWTEAHRE